MTVYALVALTLEPHHAHVDVVACFVFLSQHGDSPLMYIAYMEHVTVSSTDAQRVSFCGHAVHRSCWDNYMATELKVTEHPPHFLSRCHDYVRLHVVCNQEQSVRVNFNMRSHDAARGELLCPLCKSLSNATSQ